MMHRSIVIALTLVGCAASNEDDLDATTLDTSVETDASTDNGLGDDTSGCEPGSPGCPCVNDMCLAPLVCVDDACSWPPADTPEPGGGTAGEPPTSCVEHEDCNDPAFAPSLVCTSAGACEPAIVSRYLVRVVEWTPTNCSGGPLDGVADLWWGLSLDGELVASSPFQQGGCPGAWDHTFCVEGGGVGVGFATPFVLRLFDEDNVGAELHDELWWDYGDGVPGLVPETYLIEGAYSGPTNGGGTVTVEFVHEGC